MPLSTGYKGRKNVTHPFTHSRYLLTFYSLFKAKPRIIAVCVSPAKGVDREIGARVQIPQSAPKARKYELSAVLHRAFIFAFLQKNAQKLRKLLSYYALFTHPPKNKYALFTP